MPDHKFYRSTDRQITLLDLKQRIIDLMENTQELPEVAWDAEPLRYYKLNEKWAPIVFGWLDWLEDPAGWQDAQDDDYAGIQGILAFEEGITLDIDCGDVENCLESSTIINNITTNITNIDNSITNINDQIEEIKDETATDGVDLPPNPSMDSGATNLCRSSDYIAGRIYGILLDTWEQAKTLTVQEFIEAILGTVWFDFAAGVGFWQYAQTISSPTLAADCAAYIDNVKQAFFCAELDLTTTLEIIQSDTAIPSLEKSLWIAIIDNFRQAQIDEWAAIGTLSDDTPDCTDGCPWVVVWDFNGSYSPVGGETEIINGNTWTTVNGFYDSALGYVAIADTMLIEHPAPEQCKLFSAFMEVTKGITAAALDVNLWQRQPDGTGAEGYGPDNRVTNVGPTMINSNYQGQPVMPILRVALDAFFDLSATWGQSIAYIKIIGYGARPQ